MMCAYMLLIEKAFKLLSLQNKFLQKPLFISQRNILQYNMLHFILYAPTNQL